MALPEWLDPKTATTTGLVLGGFILMVLTLVVSYVVALLWHKYKDQKHAD